MRRLIAALVLWRASASKRPVTRAQALTNATLAASRLLHRRSPTAPCSKDALAAHRKKLAALSAPGGWSEPPVASSLAGPGALARRISQPQQAHIARQTWARAARERRAIAIFWLLFIRV